jgi:uncharacterized Zn finger protein
MGGLLGQLREIHFEACTIARPEPEALAERLFQSWLQSGWDTFAGAPETYADVLGEAGLAAFRRLAEAEWAQGESAGPEGRLRLGGSKRWRITQIMESLARTTGDVEELVAIKSRDLSMPYHYLAIAQEYRKARKRNKAMEWAERGIAAFPERPDARLRTFLADQYHSRRRHDQAMALVWSNFTDQPGLCCYQELKQHAKRAKQWPRWREKAISHLRDLVQDNDSPAAAGWRATTDASTLVEVHLFEEDIESAWQAARAGGCARHLWLRLAELREKEHPQDAVAIYQAHIQSALRNTGTQVYREVVRQLRKVHTLMSDMGLDQQFASYLADLRATHKRKRKLMSMLDRAQRTW